jgi:glyoxylase-like metal-dependent hydrolase (beta-lactamase superfamily II)
MGNRRQNHVSRRQFVASSALGLGAAAMMSSLPASLSAAEPLPREQVAPGLSLYRSGVNTAVFERNGRKLLIDPGDLTEAPGGGPADWVLVTHHHRDQASGVGRLIAAGAKLVVPAAEAKFFSEADAFWRAQRHYWTTFRPHRFTLRESVPVKRTVSEGDVLEWEGLRFEVMETPGHTDGSVTYLVEVEGQRIAFTGDLISGPGQIWEMHSLQNRVGPLTVPHLGFGGMGEMVKASLDRVLAAKATVMIPAHGVVMRDPRSAVEQMKNNFDAVMNNYLTTCGWPDFGKPRMSSSGASFDGILAKLYPDKKLPRLAPLPAAPYPPWIRDIEWTSQAIIGDDGSAFLSDCGYSANRDVIAKLKELIATKEIRRVEGIWPTHYHIDHNEIINKARQAFNAKVYVQREMLDITEHPYAYGLPYLSSVPTPVDQVMEHGQMIVWRGVKLTFYHFPGQTLYHGGLLAEKDGFKAFFTGDSWANWGIEDYCSHFRCFLGEGRGYDQCLKILLECQPNIIVQAHRGPMAVTEEYLRQTLATFQKREALCRKLFPHDDPNFGLDPYWAHAYPYRQLALPGGQVEVEVRITNHALKPKAFRAELRLPMNWKILNGAGEKMIAARTNGSIRLRAQAPAGPVSRQHVLGFTITVEGRSYGELAEAIVEVPG